MIALVRHPAVAMTGRCYGRLDVPLADPADAARLAASLPAGSVWTSPAARCRWVADCLGPHTVDDRLHELDFGDWEGRPWDEIGRDALDAWAASPAGFAPPGGETGAALAARVTAFWRALPAGDHVVITHGGPLKVLLALARRTPVDWLAPAPLPGAVVMVD